MGSVALVCSDFKTLPDLEVLKLLCSSSQQHLTVQITST